MEPLLGLHLKQPHEWKTRVKGLIFDKSGLPAINANWPENINRFKSSVASAEPIVLNLKSTRSFSKKEVSGFLAFYKLTPMSSGTPGHPD